MMMLDLCSGLGGASAAMRERGWQVITLDAEPQFGCDITADVRTWQYDGPAPDLIWASPPCREFSRESMPWCMSGNEPDMSIVLACKGIIDNAQPRYWIIENVRGAVRYFYPHFGPPAAIVGQFFLWGHFPPLGYVSRIGWRTKESRSSTATAERAMIPYSISAAVALAIELQPELFQLKGENGNENEKRNDD